MEMLFMSCHRSSINTATGWCMTFLIAYTANSEQAISGSRMLAKGIFQNWIFIMKVFGVAGKVHRVMSRLIDKIFSESGILEVFF
jgi:hypothetical protein